MSKKGEKNVKEILLEWSQRVNLNCYTKIFIYRHKPLIALIWLFILLASSGITFCLIIKSILDYFNYSIVSQIEIAYETKSLFPTVTICDNNPFTTLQAQELFEDIAAKFYIPPNDSNIFNHAKLMVSNPDFGDDRKKSLGLNLTQIKSCSFATQPCDMDKDFHWIYSMFDYGNCWQFNSNLSSHSNLKQTYNGVDFGLDVTISLKIQNKYLSSANVSDGLIVVIHNNSFIPFKNEKSLAFLKTGEKTFIGVKRIFYYKQPYPYSQCIDLSHYSSDLYDLIISNRTYRQSNCFQLCRQKLYIEKCKCNILNDGLNVDPSIKFCSNQSDIACWKSLNHNYSREECEKSSCPLECNSVEYDLSLSSLVYPSKNILRSQNDAQNESLVRFVIYYRSSEYTIIRESPQTSELDLFAKIGGTLGIFIGISIFTIFELIEILILVVHALLF